MKKLFSIATEEDNTLTEVADSDEQLKIEDDKNTLNGLVEESTELTEDNNALQDIQAADPEKAKEIAIEYFLNKLTPNKTISLENIDARVKNVLSIAQENILYRLGHSLKRIFESNGKLQKETQQLLSTSKTANVKEGVIKEPGWGRVYSVNDSIDAINGSIVISKLDSYFALMTNSNFLKLVKEIADVYDKIAIAVSKSSFTSNSVEAEKLHAIVSEVNTLSNKFDKFNRPNFNNKNDPDFVCLTKPELNKVLNLTLSILKDKEFERTFDELNKSCWEAYAKIENHSSVRLAGDYADDIRKGKMLLEILQPAANEIYDLYSVTNKLCYANIQYVKKSLD